MFYQNKQIKSKQELINCYSKNEFSSPFRSTIPLIELFFENTDVLQQVIHNVNDYELIFEKKTKIKESRRASFSDLCFQNNTSFFCIEAKRTEPKYETVRKFIEKDNRHEAVVNGWLRIINKKCKTNIILNDVYDKTYQMIHRFASACDVEDNIKTEMLYFCFDINEKKKTYYFSELMKIWHISKERVPIKLVIFKIKSTKSFINIEKKWTEEKQRNLSSEIKNAMKKKVMDISLEEIIEVKE